MTTYYLAGPMTGLPAMNYPAFHAAAAQLRSAGHQVENPAENEPCDSWLAYMRLSLTQIARSDELFMLRGWEKSKGATLEHDIAKALGMPIAYQQGEYLEPGKEAA